MEILFISFYFYHETGCKWRKRRLIPTEFIELQREVKKKNEKAKLVQQEMNSGLGWRWKANAQNN